MTTAAAALPLPFVFQPASADAGGVVTVRLRGTPPLQQPMRIYLVPSDVAGSIHSRFSPKAHFVGRLAPGRDGRGVLRFRVPPLDTGRYAAAAWSPGKPFFVQTKGVRVRLPTATAETCPVTGGGAYGNGFLSTELSIDGVVRAPRRPDGTFFAKPLWIPQRGNTGSELVVRGERLDGPGELRVLGVNWGGGSWRTAMTFSTEGCWRLTGRMGDISLTYVVKVVATG